MRVDRYLWAVRVYRTRTAATEACRTGKVRVGGATVKAATQVAVGDELHVRRGDRRLHLRVEELIGRRVGAPLVARYVTDLDPEPPRARSDGAGVEPVAGVRERGAGRPTKRERRRLDRLQGRG